MLQKNIVKPITASKINSNKQVTSHFLQRSHAYPTCLYKSRAELTNEFPSKKRAVNLNFHNH